MQIAIYSISYYKIAPSNPLFPPSFPQIRGPKIRKSTQKTLIAPPPVIKFFALIHTSGEWGAQIQFELGCDCVWLKLKEESTHFLGILHDI